MKLPWKCRSTLQKILNEDEAKKRSMLPTAANVEQGNNVAQFEEEGLKHRHQKLTSLLDGVVQTESNAAGQIVIHYLVPLNMAPSFGCTKHHSESWDFESRG